MKTPIKSQMKAAVATAAVTTAAAATVAETSPPLGKASDEGRSQSKAAKQIERQPEKEPSPNEALEIARASNLQVIFFPDAAQVDKFLNKDGVITKKEIDKLMDNKRLSDQAGIEKKLIEILENQAKKGSLIKTQENDQDVFKTKEGNTLDRQAISELSNHVLYQRFLKEDRSNQQVALYQVNEKGNYEFLLKEPKKLEFKKIDFTALKTQLKGTLSPPTIVINHHKGLLGNFLENFRKNLDSQSTQTTLQNSPADPAVKTKFDLDKVPFKQIEALGITRERLQKDGELDKLLKGDKTGIMKGIEGATATGVPFKFDGKLRLSQDKEGNVNFIIHGVRAGLTIPEKFLGYPINAEDKKNLIQKGELGKRITMTDAKSGKRFEGYLGVDKETKELVALRADKIFIPHAIKGVALDKEQKRMLVAGKPIQLSGLKSDKGELYSASVQVSAAKKGLSFTSVPLESLKETTHQKDKEKRLHNNQAQTSDAVEQKKLEAFKVTKVQGVSM